jgi:hypothetical protein
VINVDTGQSRAAQSVSHTVDEDGRTIAYITLPFVAAQIGTAWSGFDNDMNADLWINWSGTTGGYPSWRYPNAALTGAGEVCIEFLRRGNVLADYPRWRALLDDLDPYQIDGYIDEPINAWRWLQESILPLLPVSLAYGADGVYPVLWTPDPAPEAALAGLKAIGDGGTLVRQGAVRIEDAHVRNEHEIAFAPRSDSGDPGARYIATGRQQATRHELTFSTTELRQSVDLYGVRKADAGARVARCGACAPLAVRELRRPGPLGGLAAAWGSGNHHRQRALVVESGSMGARGGLGRHSASPRTAAHASSSRGGGLMPKLVHTIGSNVQAYNADLDEVADHWTVAADGDLTVPSGWTLDSAAGDININPVADLVVSADCEIDGLRIGTTSYRNAGQVVDVRATPGDGIVVATFENEDTGSVTARVLELRMNQATDSTADDFVQFIETGVVQHGTINRKSGVHGVEYNTASDQSLKQNISPANLEARAAQARSIQLFDYQWRPDQHGRPGRADFGPIFQQLRSVYPEATTDRDVTARGEPIPGMINRARLADMALALAQYLADRVDALESRIAALESPPGGTP